MKFIIARKELLEMMRDGRFRLSAGLIFLLLMLAVITGWNRYESVHQQQSEAQKSAREHFLTQGVKNPHSAAHFGVYAFQPSLPLSFVDGGVSPYTGVAVWLEAHKQDDFKYKPAQDGTVLQRFGEMSAAMVLQILLPLLIVLLTFAAWGGEREQGTLRQVLSAGVRPIDLIQGKALGVVVTMAVLIVPAALIGSVLLVAREPGNFQDELLRIAFLALFYSLYLGAFVGLALAVSARARSPRSALVGLLAFWIFNCLVAPRVMTDLSRAVHPTPSAFEFSQSTDRDLKLAHSEKQADLFRRDLLARYGVKSLDKLPISFSGASLQHSEETGNEVFDRHHHDLWSRYEKQTRFQEAGALIAPLLSVRSLSMGLAGTDFDQHRRFAISAENYRREFIAKLNGDLIHNSVGKSTYLRGNEFWQQIPAFHFDVPTVWTVLNDHQMSILLLALWTTGCGLLAWTGAAKMRIE